MKLSGMYSCHDEFQLWDSSARGLCWTPPKAITLWENMNRHITFNQNQNTDVIILWQSQIRSQADNMPMLKFPD